MKKYKDTILLTLLLWLSATVFAAEDSRYDSIVNDYRGRSIVELTRLGYKSLEKEDYDDALAIYMVAVSKGNESLKGEEMRSYIKALNNIGSIYIFDYYNPERAYPYLLRARRLAETAEEDDLLGAILDNIAKVHDNFGDSQKAIEMYNLAMSHAVRADSYVGKVIQLMVINDLINFALAHDMVREISPSLDSFSKLPQYAIPMGKYSKIMCQGLQLFLEGNMEGATATIEKAGKFIDANVDSARYVTDHNLSLANLYHMRGIEDSARIYLNQALETAINYQLPDRLPRTYKVMAIVEETCGDSIESRKMRLLAYEADERIHSPKLYATLNTLDASQKIDDLNVRLLEADIRHAHRVTVIWILTVAMILVGILLTYIFIRNRRLSASLHELVARHKASIEAEEVNARLRHDYEETIASLRGELEKHEKAADTVAETSVRQKRLTLPVDDEERLCIVGKVKDIFNQSSDIYEPDFSLERLADLTGTKPRYLSALLNDTIGKSFSVLLAEARVRHACTLLLSPEFKKTKTIESIAIEVGYRSRTHFTSVFKKATGVTPLQYVEMSK